MPNFTTEIRLGDRLCIHANPAKYPLAAGLANSYWCPLGPTPGRGWLLLLRSDLDYLLASGQQAFDLTWRQAGARAKELIFKGLYLVKTRRLGVGGPDDPDSVQLVEVADRRWIVDRWSDSGDAMFNCRLGGVSTTANADLLTQTKGHTWTTAAMFLWQRLQSVLGPFPGGVPGEGLPINFRFHGVNAWRALHQLLSAIGLTTQYNPFTASFAFVRLGDPDEAPAATAGAATQYDAQPQVPPVVLPATIRVYFHRHQRDHGQERDTEVDGNWSVAPSHHVDIATGSPAAVAGTVHAVWDDLAAIFNGSNALLNVGEVTARANFVAQRVREQLEDETVRAHSQYVGLEAFVPHTQTKAVRWRSNLHRGDEGTATETVNHHGLPAGFEPTRGASLLDHLDWWPSSGENLAPPDLARHSYPLWPRLPNAVQVIVPTAPLGELVTPPAGNVFPGKLRRQVGDQFVTLEDVWIGIFDDFEETQGNVPVRNYDVFLGRLSGTTEVNGERRPLYVARRGGRWSAEQECYSPGMLTWGQAVDWVNQLVASKRSSLYVAQVNDVNGNPVRGAAALGIGGGPTDSLFWTGGGGAGPANYPRWHQSPRIGRNLTIGTLGGGWLFLSDGVNQYGLSAGTAQNLHLPNNTPAGRGAHLICDDVQGNCVQSAWSPQGANGTLYLYDCYTQACQYFTVQHGLLVSGPGLTTPATPGLVTCPIEYLDPYDPCAT